MVAIMDTVIHTLNNFSLKCVSIFIMLCFCTMQKKSKVFQMSQEPVREETKILCEKTKPTLPPIQE